MYVVQKGYDDFMINFIVCDNNKHILENVVATIDNIMMKNNISYKVFPFSEYNNNFKSKVEAKKANTIYILDIHDYDECIIL